MAGDALEKTEEKQEQAGKGTAFKIGDTVKVYLRIKEGDKERLQMFKGTVIARKGRGATETFTVRRISYGVGVERIFPVRSPHIERIEVEGSSRVRRAKLYYLRHMSAKRSGLRG
ncbi:MAG: 50S ribosomal protein L19 [Kiritimatiellae bacterium]|nr:50S ribosomal protein L19 [Kiritimatiellia bacterium]